MARTKTQNQHTQRHTDTQTKYKYHTSAQTNKHKHIQHRQEHIQYRSKTQTYQNKSCKYNTQHTCTAQDRTRCTTTHITQHNTIQHQSPMISIRRQACDKKRSQKGCGDKPKARKFQGSLPIKVRYFDGKNEVV